MVQNTFLESEGLRKSELLEWSPQLRILLLANGHVDSNTTVGYVDSFCCAQKCGYLRTQSKTALRCHIPNRRLGTTLE